MNIYVVPTNSGGLKSRFFEESQNEWGGGNPNVLFWKELWPACERQGAKLHTFDESRPEGEHAEDVLVVMNHPDDGPVVNALRTIRAMLRGTEDFERRRRLFLNEHAAAFPKRILLQFEPPVVTPYVYRHFPDIRKRFGYTKIFAISGGFPGTDLVVNYYRYRTRDITSPLFNATREKFLVMVNSNQRPHDFGNELYGERLRAIRHFSASRDFDLFGHGFDRAPRHPFYIHYASAVRRAWRGAIPDKLKTTAEYRFALCFENCAHPGYVSEKIFDVLAVGTVPVYLGAPDIATLVPPECFIDARRFATYAELEKHLRSLTAADIERYRSAILTFLSDKTTIRGIDPFVTGLLA